MATTLARSQGYTNDPVSRIAAFHNIDRKILLPVVMSYSGTSKARRFAQAQMLDSTERLVPGDTVHYQYVDTKTVFERSAIPNLPLDNQGANSITFNVLPRSFKVCQQWTGETKVSNVDRYRMRESGREVYNEAIGRAIASGAKSLMDPYFFHVIAARSDASNLITAAGGAPLNLSTEAGVRTLIHRLINRALIIEMADGDLQVGNEIRNNIRLALPICAHEGVFDYFDIKSQCCDVSGGVRARGLTIGPLGIDIEFVKDLPRDASGNFIGVWMDTSMAAAPTDWLELNWYNVKGDEFFKFHFVYDAELLNPEAAGGILVQAS